LKVFGHRKASADSQVKEVDLTRDFCSDGNW
jgi:hypothetical protein